MKFGARNRVDKFGDYWYDSRLNQLVYVFSAILLSCGKNLDDF